MRAAARRAVIRRRSTVACGFGTAYEAIVRAEINGRDAVLVTGSRPGRTCRRAPGQGDGRERVIGYNRSPTRSELAISLGAVDEVVTPGSSPDEVVEQVMELTKGRGVEVAVDCSGAAPLRGAALRATRAEGRLVLVGRAAGWNSMSARGHPPAATHPRLMGHLGAADGGPLGAPRAVGPAP
jgi:threonine dehydrogenase-like Zn-dependent dehydrogenase